MIGDISKDDFNKRHNKMCITEGINFFFFDRNFPLDCELCWWKESLAMQS